MRFPRHHRLEEVLKFREWRNPIKHNSCAHNGGDACGLSEGEQPCALEHVRFIIDWNRGAKLLHDVAKAWKLGTRVVRVLTRDGQMSRNAVNFEIRKCRDLLE